MWSKFDDIVDIFLCSMLFELIKSTLEDLKKMPNYFPIISRKLTKVISPYSKSEATLQIASVNGKTLVPHVSPPADNTLQKVLQRKSPIYVTVIILSLK